MLKQIEEKDEYGNKTTYTVDENGVKQGSFEFCFYDGSGYGKGTYKDGKKDGVCEVYHENGQLAYSYTYEDGAKEGEARSYYPNGQLKDIYIYKGGNLVDTIESYYEDGTQKKKTFPSIEGSMVEEYHENGRVSKRCYYRDGKPDGPCETYDYYGESGGKIVYDHGRMLKDPDEVAAYLKKWQMRRKEVEEKQFAEEKRQAEEKERHAEEVKRAMAIGGLKGQLELLADPAFRKSVGKAKTPERQAKAEEIVEVRRARTLLSRAAKKALDEGDKKLFSEIEKVARPYALHNRRIELEFQNKRAERRSKRGRG